MRAAVLYEAGVARGAVPAAQMRQPGRVHVARAALSMPGTESYQHTAKKQCFIPALINKGVAAYFRLTRAARKLKSKRRVVERTHVWTERWRRTVMHHDRKHTC